MTHFTFKFKSYTKISLVYALLYLNNLPPELNPTLNLPSAAN